MISPSRREVWLDSFRRVSPLGIPPVWLPKDFEKRHACRRDLVRFAEEYFPHLYYRPVAYHVETLTREQDFLLTRDPVVLKTAEAGPRGIGKTTLRIILTIWALLYGHSRMVLWIRKTAKGDEGAESRLKSIKGELLNNERLCADFPEICEWVRSFGGDPSRVRAPYIWLDSRIKMPGPRYCLTGGVESSMVGLNVEGTRPDLIIFDDLETRRSSGSNAEQKTLRESFNTDLIKIHDINRRALYIQLGNIRTEKSLIAENCDRNRQPGWRGTIYKALIQKPDKEDMWENFLDLFRGHLKLPPEAEGITDERLAEALGYTVDALQSMACSAEGIRNAYAYYCAHKAEMDAGAKLLDPHRLPLVRCYHTIADEGLATFQSEYQNEPPALLDAKESALDVQYLRTKETGIPAGMVPPWGRRVIVTIDVGQHRLHWEADAWDEAGETSQVIAVGVRDTTLDLHGKVTLSGADIPDPIIAMYGCFKAALGGIRQIIDEGWVQEDTGEIFTAAAVLVDVGGTATLSGGTAWYGVIQRICVEFGAAWVPFRGSKFTQKVIDRAGGRCWIIEQKENPNRRVDAFADFYKLQLLDAYRRGPFKEDGSPVKGTRLLHAGIPLEYLRHQTSEKLAEGTAEGKVIDRAFFSQWVLRPRGEGGYGKNHWWDTAWMQFAGADYLDVRSKPRRRVAYGVVGRAFA